MRNPAKQVLVSRLIRQLGTDLVYLDGPDATVVGLLLAQSGTTDLADAHVIVCARRAVTTILTSDPENLRNLAPEIRLEPI